MLVNKSKELFANFSTADFEMMSLLLKSNLKITSDYLAKIMTTTTFRIKLEVAADLGSLFGFLFFFVNT